MPINLWVTIGTILFVSSALIYHIYLIEKEHDHSLIMASSMMIGMLISVIFGLFFGAVFRQDLFSSTLLSIGAGMFFGGIGGFAGISAGISTLYEGLLSGLMGGMMGAMTGKMVTVNESEILIQLTTLLYTFLAFILIIFLRRNVNKKKWFDDHPSIIFLILAIYFVLYHHLGPIIPLE